MSTKSTNQSSRLRRATEHPILSGVIVAAIVAICGSILATVKGAWPAVLAAVWSGITTAWFWLGSTTGVWNWLLSALVVVSLAAIVGISLAALQSPSPATPQTYRDYTSDSFEGLRWFWSYDFSDRVSGIYPCCPDCLLQLKPTYNVRGYSGDRVTYACEHCKVTKASFDEHHHELESRIERFIHKKLRTGEWRSVSKVKPAGAN